MKTSKQILEGYSNEELRVFLKFIKYYLKGCRSKHFHEYLCSAISSFYFEENLREQNAYCRMILTTLGIKMNSSYAFTDDVDICHRQNSEHMVVLRNTRRVFFLFCVRETILEILNDRSVFAAR